MNYSFQLILTMIVFYLQYRLLNSSLEQVKNSDDAQVYGWWRMGYITGCVCALLFHIIYTLWF